MLQQLLLKLLLCCSYGHVMRNAHIKLQLLHSRGSG